MIEPAMTDRPGIEFPGRSFSMQVCETRLLPLQPARAEDDIVSAGEFRLQALRGGRGR